MLNRVRKKLDRYFYQKEWRKSNSHNTTVVFPEMPFRFDSVSVGNNTYGTLKVLNHSTKEKLRIGHFCSIAPEVVFILNADHYTNNISTYPYKVKMMGDRFEATSKGDIVVGDDVWIGYGAIILSGVTIGQGAIIAAGSIVTKDVPPYAIVGGNPAKVIKYRFSKDICGEMMRIDYSKVTNDLMKRHIEDLYTEVTCVEQLDWLPKK